MPAACRRAPPGAHRWTCRYAMNPHNKGEAPPGADETAGSGRPSCPFYCKGAPAMAARLPLVVLPSWSEAQPPTRLVDAILALPIRFDVLLVDPANGDADRLARERDEVHVLHAPSPDDGYLAAYRWALEQGYTHVLELDPHASPQQLPVLLGEMDGADLVVGSRFAEESERAAGGWRRALSAGGNRLTQAFLGLATRDCTSGLRCYRSALLECIPWDAIPSRE